MVRTLQVLDPFIYYQNLLNYFAKGIVIKYESMTYKTAVHLAGSLLNLHNKASKCIRQLFEVDNEVECIRLITNDYEMITAQMSNFTIAVKQTNAKVEQKKAEEKAASEEKAAAAN